MLRLGSFARVRHTGERGAAAVLVAILFAGGAVMGMLALSADIGSIMNERRQLQNGSDASSMALAQLCAKNDPVCTDANAPAGIKPWANANAKDQLSTISNVCASGVAGITNPCEAGSASELAKCAPAPSWLTGGIPFVEVKTRTESTSGNTVLTPFARVLTGSSGTSVASCARAAWGQPGAYSGTIPMTLSACEWKEQTNNGTDWVQDKPAGAFPGYGGAGQPSWPAVTKEVTILVHDPGDESGDCDWNGKDTSGGFGWVSNSNCAATVTTDGWAQIDTGNNTPQTCKDIIPTLVGKVLSLPVFDCLVASNGAPVGPPPTTPGACDPTQQQSSGNNSWYHIGGWAQFYLSGYSLTSDTRPSVMPGGATDCSAGNGNGSRCIFGWFLKGQLDATSIIPPGGPNNFGTYTVLPAG
jgi:Flp pilus assembly protein TadG